ncbi:uncharacterized protein [Chironomus tepperi]|uniref:uncharacterized protein n=1 Tax=Chironomus tepperi TaxID=113505 RepID=UPI00391F771A
MNIKQEKEVPSSPGTSKSSAPKPKKYCDRQFKIQLARALKANFGEADNFDKIKCNKLLSCYEDDKIIDSTNNLAEDIQQSVENSIESQRTKEIINLARNVDDLIDVKKPQEIPLLIKLNSVSRFPSSLETKGVNFEALSKFLYSSVSGSLDFADMNYETKLVLHDTYNMLMEQVEKDAPKVLEDFKSKMTGSSDINQISNTENLTEALQDSSINPFNIPIEFLLQRKSSE